MAHQIYLKSSSKTSFIQLKKTTLIERIVHSENAMNTADDELRRELLNFVVVGGGPTGVEMAGAIAEMKRSEERRVGQECLRLCKYRWSP